MEPAETRGAALRRLVANYPALLRVGFVSALAYRAEFLIWILTTNLPLINLALWTAVARDAPVGRWGQRDFVAYFLAVLIVRLLTGCWVVWELTMEIRQGTLAMRLLRPVHPLIAYSAENLAAVPIRAVVSLPVALVLLGTVGPQELSHDPVVWALVPLMILGAWLMVFLVMSIVGSCALFVESAASLYEVWLGLFTVFSGYLVPLDLFPPWLRALADVLPFRLMMAFPVEAMLGHLTAGEIARDFALQGLWIAVFLAVLRLVWNAGMRRFAAYGG